MRKFSKLIIILFLVIDVILLGYILIGSSDVPLLNPHGQVAVRERNLIITLFLLMSIVAIPVFAATIFITSKYKEENSKEHSPEEDHSKKLIWWIIPGAIVLIMAAVTWKSTHALDPSKPLVSDKKPIRIQVVALRWKWLFIYPEQNIATVNFVEFPEKTPVIFELTADAPMNSFWIPALSGQIYAMTGMGTKLNLIADKTGEFPGYAAEINGKGFSGMKFTAKASSQEDFDKWVQSIKQSSNPLTLAEYEKISKPSENNPIFYYSSADKNLYDTIIMKYMAPSSPMENSQQSIPTMHDITHY